MSFSIALTMSDADRSRDKERRRRFLAYFNGPPYRGDRARLMQTTGLSKGRVSQYFDEAQPFGERAARALANKLDLADDAFLSEQGAVKSAIAASLQSAGGFAEFEPPSREALLMSQQIPTLVYREPPTLEWGEIRVGKMEDRFRTQMPDRSMEPGIPKGRWLVFDRATSAPDNRRVIVRVNYDQAQIYVRRIKEVDGGWLAKPDDDDFDTFDSRKVPLEVIALLSHIETPDEG